MRKIQLKRLSLLNFKGIRKLEITDFQKETNIFGANATGKTTIVDAFTWLLFGKDSTERTNFEIKTLDKENNVIHKLDHEVEAVIDVDGEEMALKRTYREKWVKKRGALESELGGNETLYHWNDVPMTQRDYNAKISDLVDEGVFKMITSPIAFNALKWNDQRQVLLDISGGVTDEEVAKKDPEFQNLLQKVTNKSLSEYEKQVKASVKKAKDEIKAIPTRIDEVERGKPEAVDFADVERDLKANQKELKEVEDQISDKLNAQQEVLNKKTEIQKHIHSLESEIEDEKHKLKLQAKQEYQKQTSVISDIQAKIDSKNEDLSTAKRTFSQLENVRKSEQDDVNTYTEKNNGIREQWNKRNAETFQMDADDCKCPTCNREFEAENLEEKRKELEENFISQQQKDLQELTQKGQANKKIIESAKEEISKLDARIEKGKEIIEGISEEIGELNEALETAKDNTDVKSQEDIYNGLYSESIVIHANVKDISTLKEKLEKVEKVDVSDLKAKKDQYTKEIEQIKEKLAAKDQIAKANVRIASLQKEESELAQKIADYERDQHTIEQFNRAKDTALEQLVNDRFEFVNFKLFESQVNGAEVPTCKALIDGVPFSDANTASKINAGIDIINTLCDHYEVSAPIFIDNRESVSELIHSKSQIINLIVSAKDKKLRVESPEVAEMF